MKVLVIATFFVALANPVSAAVLQGDSGIWDDPSSVDDHGQLLPIENIAPSSSVDIAKIQCKPLPRFNLDAEMAQADWIYDFDNSKKISSIVDVFLKAYANLCSEGLIKSNVGIASSVAVDFANAPDANVASLYDAERTDEFSNRILIFEYPFEQKGVFSVPGYDEVREAIYCEEVGPTEQEIAKEGRCLVD